ncbi:MAG: hypothetical protein ABTQ34_09105 [Bdellovibrionales bacterium]
MAKKQNLKNNARKGNGGNGGQGKETQLELARVVEVNGKRVRQTGKTIRERDGTELVEYGLPNGSTFCVRPGESVKQRAISYIR